MSKELEEMLGDVEEADRACVVASRYVFRKVQFGGKTFLEALSKDDLLAELDRSDESKDSASRR